MKFLDRCVDYLKRTRAPRDPVRLPEVELAIIHTSTDPHSFLYPGLIWSALLYHQDSIIGSARYGIDPLDETLYVFSLHIDQAHQRHLLGLATLWSLHQRYHKPVRPVDVLPEAMPFWIRAQSYYGKGAACVGSMLTQADTVALMPRWKHLVPAPLTERERDQRRHREWIESERAAGRAAHWGDHEQG